MSKNFEKEYKESISRATKILGNCDEPIDTNVKEAIEAIFPTLKKDKTNDQKWEILKSMIHSNVPDNIYSFYRLSRKDFEAWLDDKSKEISVLKDQIESLTAALKLFRESKHEPVVSEEVINEGIAHFGITQYQIDNWLKKHFNVVRDPCKDCKSPMLNCHNFPCVKKKAFKQSESIFEVIRREQSDEQLEKLEWDGKIKSHTDIGQSKRLAEILLTESADMYWDDITSATFAGAPPKIAPTGSGFDWGFPSWSLVALLDVLPNGTDIVKAEADTENEHYMCTVGIKDDIISTFGNNPVDACYEMIIKLHELNLL